MLVTYLEFWDDKQNYVPYVRETILTYVPIEGEVTDSYVNGFPDLSCKVVPLHAYYA